MNIYDKKEYFVKTFLKELLLAIDNDILDVYYYVFYHSEYVVIVMKSGCEEHIRVNGSSFLTMARDVLNNVSNGR